MRLEKRLLSNNDDYSNGEKVNVGVDSSKDYDVVIVGMQNFL